MKHSWLTLVVLAASSAVALRPSSLASSEHARGLSGTPARAVQTPQKSFKNRYGIEMVYIPSGEFMMGAEHPAHGRILANDTEKPIHRVRIAYGFYMSRYEITQAQWQVVMGNNPSYSKGPNLPVESVSFASAIRFTNKLNTLSDGYNYRLPSEAEWEYACRAGTTGDTYGDLDQIAWYSDNSGLKTHPVGKKQPNAFGLYDMLGNVWELCADLWHRNYQGAPTDGSTWTKGGGASGHVVRGGSRVGATYEVTSTVRMISSGPPGSGPFAGVRLVSVPR